jgi:branched-chain amino acid transport system ATP-binding protein
VTDATDGPAVVLRVEDVERSFGGVQALRGATLELRAGETLGLIGPNGAGKTTLFDVISGFVMPTSGTVELLGEDVTDLSPERRALLGLGRSFQDARLFPALTVEETLLVTLDRHHQARGFAGTTLGLPKARKAEATLRRRAERLMMLLNITDFRDKFVRELSTGSRRLVDLACVLAGDPDVLLLDEPSSGIAQRETEELPALLDRIKFETGCALLIIEHDMQLISAVSDELVAMELGRVVVRGTPTDVLNDPRVVAAYLGNDSAVIRRSGQPAGRVHEGPGVTL